MVAKLQNASTSTLDVPAIVEFFGGRQALVSQLHKYEIVTLSFEAVAKWMVRHQIPAARLHDLQTLAKLTKRRLDLSKFTPDATKIKKKVA